MNPPSQLIPVAPGRRPLLSRCLALAAAVLPMFHAGLEATPANKAALNEHYGLFLAENLNRCSTCHLPSTQQNPTSLDEYPHNPFGNRLRIIRAELDQAGQKSTLDARLARIASEDSDGDGVSNEIELLLGHHPGDPGDKPTSLADAPKRQAEFQEFLAGYHWRPFERVRRPKVPDPSPASWVRNPLDAFIAAEHGQRNLQARPEASRILLLRRVYLDLIGLTPTPHEQATFENDPSPNAYEAVVDRLLEDPRYGERWGRHWMDIWRYSDWAGWSGGNQIRDSKPHIWRWRDWIVESLNLDKGYDQMLLEMLAADELAPEDPQTLRATGFLVRNYKMLSREQWLEDTVKHTSQAFLGLTIGCAKCHDHMRDPISQDEYYKLRAVFEPHQVRTDRVPGELDTAKNGLVRAYDLADNPPTFFFIRGDERTPDTNRWMRPAVPRVLCSTAAEADLAPAPVDLPRFAAQPDKRPFVIAELRAASERTLEEARAALAKLQTEDTPKPDLIQEKELQVALAEASHGALLAVLEAERLEDAGGKHTAEWERCAQNALSRQRETHLLQARLSVLQARHTSANAKNEKDRAAAEKKIQETEKALAAAEKEAAAPLTAEYKPRPVQAYPDQSTGRRLAFARWVANASNPLTARVAVNHIWLRHFGRGLVPTPADFGRNGLPPSHPELLDWLAAELMERGWSMKALHRLILTSNTYRMASTPDAHNLAIDPDNIYLWRAPSRRMEAELVRDNLLYVSGDLDPAMGGPDIPHTEGLTSKRRSLYLRIAAEKEVEFLRIFDGPSVNECYERHPTVRPQQALALANSPLPQAQAKRLAAALSSDQFVPEAFRRVLARLPTPQETELCHKFLEQNSADQRANLILVLFNHNDFVTIR